MKCFSPWALIISAWFFVLPGCAVKAKPAAEEKGMSKKISPFSYKNENAEMVMVVGVELAKRRLDENFFPLEVKIANKRLDSLLIERENLVLVDEQGRVYQMPDIQELQQYYDKLAADHKFKSQTGLLTDSLETGFSAYIRTDSNFFPQTQGAARVINSVYIQKNGYMEDLVYFPMPEGGISGKILRLRVDVPEIERPFDVAFKVN